MGRPGFSGQAYRLDLVAGLTDGILTALTLGAGHMLLSGSQITVGLAFRVACAAAISGAFIFLVAHYADLRGELVEAERQLNLTSHGRLAASHLGLAAFFDAATKAMIASACTFVGALLPMLVGALIARPRWLPMAVSIIALSLLGFFLARRVWGRAWRWVLALALAGVVLTYIGAKLKIV
jgi:VIT1/CCC1 family predicted Fe2+/Mn2+ transporter